MFSRVNIYLLTVLAMGGLALTVRASTVPGSAIRAAATCSTCTVGNGGAQEPVPPETEGVPAAPSDSMPPGAWYTSLSQLSVPVQLAFAAARTAVSEADSSRVPIPEVLPRATHDRAAQWLGDQTGSGRSLNPTSGRVEGSRGSEVCELLRHTLDRLGPPLPF